MKKNKFNFVHIANLIQNKKGLEKSNPFLWCWRRGSCLVRSHLTAIPHFAYWTLSNCKTAPASARSRNSQKSLFNPLSLQIKKTHLLVSLFNGAGDEARTHVFVFSVLKFPPVTSNIVQS